MVFSRPPREKTLFTAIETQRLGMPSRLEIVTGKEDEVCDWQQATQVAAKLGIDISVLEDEGHMIATEKVSLAIAQFLSPL